MEKRWHGWAGLPGRCRPTEPAEGGQGRPAQDVGPNTGFSQLRPGTEFNPPAMGAPDAHGGQNLRRLEFPSEHSDLSDQVQPLSSELGIHLSCQGRIVALV